jgi:hypothetical protein
LIAWRTRSSVSAEARRVSPLTMRDTVEMETPACRATSLNETGPSPRCFEFVIVVASTPKKVSLQVWQTIAKFWQTFAKIGKPESVGGYVDRVSNVVRQASIDLRQKSDQSFNFQKVPTP